MLAGAGRERHYLAGNCGAPLSGAMLAADVLQRSPSMTPQHILTLNACATAACAAGMLAARGALYPHFGLSTPLLLDVIGVGLLVYAGALLVTARREVVDRRTLVTFTVADAAWVVGSAVALAIFWSELTPLARALVIAVALAVEVLATLQYRAAGTLNVGSPRMA
jgi:hypothetical protein